MKWKNVQVMKICVNNDNFPWFIIVVTESPVSLKVLVNKL